MAPIPTGPIQGPVRPEKMKASGSPSLTDKTPKERLTANQRRDIAKSGPLKDKQGNIVAGASSATPKDDPLGVHARQAMRTKEAQSRRIGGHFQKLIAKEMGISVQELEQIQAENAKRRGEEVKDEATREGFRQQVIQTPEEFGLQRPDSLVDTANQTAVNTEPQQPIMPDDPSYWEKFFFGGYTNAEGEELLPLTFPLIGPSGQAVNLLKNGIKGVQIVGGAGKAERVISSPIEAVKAGNGAKNEKIIKSVGGKIAAWSAAVFLGLGTADKISDLFGAKLDDQQQAVNTLGQVTSSIVGSGKSASGDYKESLKQLDTIESQILELEAAIKAGTITKAKIRINGQVIDINADVTDQLATIQEGRNDLQAFALEGQFPEMTPFEIQRELRILAEEGYIKPVSFKHTERPTT